MTILLGSETWEVSVTCSVCDRTEVMYVPTSLDANDVREYLIGRGWAVFRNGVWVCDRND